MRTLVRASLLPALLLAIALEAAAPLPVPSAAARRINDFAGALSGTDLDRLERKLAERERSSTNQIVVAIFRSLRGESLEDYSVRVAQAWRVGHKGLDNGVVFLIFLDDRRMRLEVGYGLEGTLTDAVASAILAQAVAPRFREGKVADGIAAGLDAIDKAIAGTYGRSRPGARSDDAIPLL
ncbi:MAG TPA: TPM domain-containing protein, partial [Longimicrobiaceae bacterium]|nr:TPM domain-containing protein [Longimicrobiaceae bacterium]